MKSRFLFILLCCWQMTFAQKAEIDSLEAILDSNKVYDTTYVDLLLLTGNKFYTSNPQKTIEYAKKARELSVDIDYRKGIAGSYNTESIGYWARADFDKAIESCKSGLEVIKNTALLSMKGRLLNNLGLNYNNQGSYDLALDAYLQALDISVQTGNKLSEGKYLNNIGGLYLRMENYEKATKYYQESMQLKRAAGDQNSLAMTMMNLGYIHQLNKSYDKAGVILRQTIDIFNKAGNKRGESKATNNLGELMAAIGKHDSALMYLQRSFLLKDEIGDKKGKIAILLNTGSIYQETSQFESAGKSFRRAAQLSKELGTIEYLRDIYMALSELSKKTGKYKEALRYYEEYTALNDSLLSMDMRSNIAELQTKYDSEKKEKENELLRREQQLKDQIISQQGSVNQSITIIMVLAIVLIVILTYAIIVKSKANKKLKGLNKEIQNQKRRIENANDEIRESNVELRNTIEQLNMTQSQLIESEKMASIGKLTAGIAHELNNPLNYIGGIVNPVKKDLDEIRQLITPDNLARSKELFDELELLINNVETGTENARLVVENLMKLSASEEVELKFDYGEIEISHLVHTSSYLLKKTHPEIRFEKINDKESHEVRIYGSQIELNQVMGNIYQNCIQAIPDTIQGKIVTKISKKERHVEITISDNGIGIEHDALKTIFDPFYTTKGPGEGSGLGLSVAYNVIKKHNGELSIESEIGSGTTALITLPIVETG